MHGHLTEWGAQQLRADKFFYGLSAIHPQHGLAHWQMIEVVTDRSIAEGVTQAAILVDHPKFGRVAPALALPVNKLDTIITAGKFHPSS